MKLESFEDLECWKAGRELRQYVALAVVPRLPSEERRRLGDQILRAARSVTANVAEGFGRFHYVDNAKFCRTALGSCCEVLDHLLTGHDEALITSECLAAGRLKVEKARNLLMGYIAYLRRASKSAEAKG